MDVMSRLEGINYNTAVLAELLQAMGSVFDSTIEGVRNRKDCETVSEACFYWVTEHYTRLAAEIRAASTLADLVDISADNLLLDLIAEEREQREEAAKNMPQAVGTYELGGRQYNVLKYLCGSNGEKVPLLDLELEASDDFKRKAKETAAQQLTRHGIEPTEANLQAYFVATDHLIEQNMLPNQANLQPYYDAMREGGDIESILARVKEAAKEA